MNKSELVERVVNAAGLEQRANIAASNGVKSAKSAKSTKKR